MLWLVNDRANGDGAPAGLVLKERLGKLTIVDGQWQIRPEDTRTYPTLYLTDIRRYLDTGCDLASSAPGETMTRAEAEMISEL